MQQQRRLFLPNLLDKVGSYSTDLPSRHTTHLHSIKQPITKSYKKSHHQHPTIQQRQSISNLLGNITLLKQNQLLGRLLTENYSQKKDNNNKTKYCSKQDSFNKSYHLQMNYMASNLNVKHMEKTQKLQTTHQNNKIFSIKPSLLTKQNFTAYNEKVMKKYSLKGESGKQNKEKLANQINQKKIKFLKKLQPLNQFSSQLLSKNSQNLISYQRQRLTYKPEPRECFSEMRKFSYVNNEKQTLFLELKAFDDKILPWQNHNENSQKDESLDEIFAIDE